MLRVSLTRHRGVLARRGVALTVACQRGCRILVRATLRAYRTHRVVRLGPSTRALPAGLRGHVRLRIARHALTILRRQLGRARGLEARVTVLATGPTGRRTTLHRSYLVTR